MVETKTQKVLYKSNYLNEVNYEKDSYSFSTDSS